MLTVATWNWMALWAVIVALGTQTLLGFSAYPIAEDFSYAPLAEIWADPGLYPRDDLLHGTANYAWAYNAVYWLAKSTVGIAAGFWIAVMVLSIVSVMALRAIMVRVGAAGVALPLAIALGVMVLVPGVGRGLFGGFVGSYFHHQWIALALVMWAFVAVLGGRAVLAGLLLGAAAYTQPMSALHGALAIAVACATQGRSGVRMLGIIGAVTGTAALPYVILVILPALGEPGAPIRAARLVEDIYLFYSPYRYEIAPSDLLLGWGYLALGLASAAMLRRNRPAEAMMALGLICGLGALHGVTTVFYFAIESRYPLLYILDATRSSPLFFALSAALFAAAMEQRIEAGLTGAGWKSPVTLVAAGAAGLTILTLNTTPLGWFFALSGALLISAPDRMVPKAALAVMLVALYGLTAYKVNLRPVIDQHRAGLFDWAARETGPDALFIVPPGMHGFRLFARRSVYVDFKLASLAQPGLAWAARARLEQVAQPGPKALAARGGEARRLWDRAYTRAATCPVMARIMRKARADYFVRPKIAGSGDAGLQPDCRGHPRVAFANTAMTVYSMTNYRNGASE
jgi:hypothetical protein